MSKTLSESKNKIVMLVILVAAVITKTMIAMFSKGKPSVGALIFGVLMCIFSVALLFFDFPMTKEALFEGKNIFRIIAALVIFIGAFSELYVNLAFNMIMTIIPIAVFCSSDTKFIPISVVACLSIFLRYDPFAFTVIPAAIFVTLILVAPKIKESKLWEKLVFAAALISYVIAFCCVAHELRFNFSMSTFVASLTKTIPLMLIAAFCIACAVMSIKADKPSKNKKKAKKNDYSSKAKKPEYLAAFTYTAVAVYCFAAAMLEGKYAMCSIVALLLSLFMVCRNETQVQLVSDKVAKAAEGFIDKISDKTEEK